MVVLASKHLSACASTSPCSDETRTFWFSAASLEAEIEFALVRRRRGGWVVLMRGPEGPHAVRGAEAPLTAACACVLARLLSPQVGAILGLAIYNQVRWACCRCVV